MRGQCLGQCFVRALPAAFSDEAGLGIMRVVVTDLVDHLLVIGECDQLFGSEDFAESRVPVCDGQNPAARKDHSNATLVPTG